MKNTSAEKLIVFDESGAHLAMIHSYGQVESHQRLHYPAPYARGKNYSMIAAITPHTIVGSWYCEGTMDRHFFTEFISHFLVPILTPHYGIILDDVAFHKVKLAIELIEKTGARITFHLLK